jgi:hypothetical protein
MRLTLGLNALLYFLNAILWATVAKQPGVALLWGGVALGNLWYIKKLVNEGVW